MKVLKFYQYEKIEFLFEEIKNELGHDLSKSYNDMSEEKHTFWYGYFEKSFYDKKERRAEHG